MMPGKTDSGSVSQSSILDPSSGPRNGSLRAGFVIHRGQFPMEYRPLGKTGLKVSLLAQGGAAFGQQFGPVSAAEAADCIHAAIDSGVNLVDTAAYYGRGLAEELLGKAL